MKGNNKSARTRNYNRRSSGSSRLGTSGNVGRGLLSWKTIVPAVAALGVGSYFVMSRSRKQPDTLEDTTHEDTFD